MSKHIQILSRGYRRTQNHRLAGPIARRLAPVVRSVLSGTSEHQAQGRASIGAVIDPRNPVPSPGGPPGLLDEVTAHFKARRWVEVVSHLADFVDGGRLPEVWYANLAIAYCGLDLYDEAESVIQAGWAVYGRTRMLDIEWAQTALKRHAAIDAVARYNEIIGREGADTPARVYLGLANAHRLRADHDTADQVLEEGRQRRPESSELDCAWATQPTHDADWVEAVARHQKLIDANDLPDAALFVGLENACRRLGDLPGAIDAAERGMALWPDDESLVQARANLAMATADWADALRWWEQLVSVSSPGQRQRFTLPEAGPLMIWYDTAWRRIAERWDDLVAGWVTPPSVHLFIAMTRILTATREPDHALTIADRGLDIYPLSRDLRHSRRLAELSGRTGNATTTAPSGIEPDPSLQPLDLDRQMVEIERQFADLRQPAPDQALPRLRLLHVVSGTALDHYIRAGHHYDTTRVDRRIRELSETDDWPEMTGGTPPVEQRARTLARAYVRRFPRPPTPASYQAEAVFRLLYAELCVFEPARRVARSLARSVGADPVFIEVSRSAPTYLSFFTATEMGQIYLYAELRRWGVNAYLCRFSAAGTEEGEDAPSFSIQPNPAVCWSRPQTFVDDRPQLTQAVVPAGIRSVKQVIGELDHPLVYSSGQIVSDFAYDRSMNSTLELGGSFIPHRSQVPTFDYPLVEVGGIESRYLTGDGELIRTPVLQSEPLGRGWLDLLDRALGSLIDEIRRRAAREIEERGLNELHIADALYLESSVFAAAVKANGGRVVLWPHSANPADADSRAANSFDQVVAVTATGCEQWRTAHPGVDVVHNSGLMLAPPLPPTFERGAPVSVVVIGGRNVVGLMPLVNQSAHEEAYRRLFTQLDALTHRADLTLHYKPKGRRGETEMWLDGLLDGQSSWTVVEEHPLRMELPNMIFVTVSCGSSAILEGIGRGVPGLMVSETVCHDYTTVDAKIVRSSSVTDIVGLIERCCDPDEYLALIDSQQTYYRSQLASPQPKGTPS